MKVLGNIIWLIFGGLHIALEYFFASFALMITIIGIPFGLQSLKLGVLAIWPFGSQVKEKESQSGCLNLFMNVLWFFVGGIWIFLTHILYGVILCITIIGIPFGKMHFRLAKLALSPFGKEVV
ncbi:MAG: YccF domain-containing protein [Bacteroidaceae bacterium]|nr:YccF domain-containing protein [Bacteroidaceae bacterium]